MNKRNKLLNTLNPKRILSKEGLAGAWGMHKGHRADTLYRDLNELDGHDKDPSYLRRNAGKIGGTVGAVAGAAAGRALGNKIGLNKNFLLRHTLGNVVTGAGGYVGGKLGIESANQIRNKSRDNHLKTRTHMKIQDIAKNRYAQTAGGALIGATAGVAGGYLSTKDPNKRKKRMIIGGAGGAVLGGAGTHFRGQIADAGRVVGNKAKNLFTRKTRTQSGFISDHKRQLIGTGIGAAVGAGTGYAVSRKVKNKKKKAGIIAGATVGGAGLGYAAGHYGPQISSAASNVYGKVKSKFTKKHSSVLDGVQTRFYCLD